MPTADKDTEAPCRFSEDFLQKHTFRDFNSAEQQFWFQPFFYFFFQVKSSSGTPRQTLWLLIECEQPRLPNSRVFSRFGEILSPFCIEFLNSCADSQASFQLSPRGFSPLSFAIHILVKRKQLAKISTYNRNQEMFTRPGCSAVRNPWGVSILTWYDWLFTL